MLTADGIATFLVAKTAKGLSPNTLESYRYRLDVFARFCPELPDAPEPIERFLASTGPSPENQDGYFRVIRTLYRWLERRQIISKNPVAMVERPMLRPKVARGLTGDSLSVLLNHPRHSQAVRAFLYLLVDTGLRLSEALSIDGSDLFTDETVRVVGKVGEREVPISRNVQELVLDALPWPWAERQSAGLAVRRAFRRAGFSGKRASAQTIRHTFVRLWQGDESLLVGIMGWTSPRMLQVYRPYDIRRAVAQHHQCSPLRAARNGARQLLLI